MRSLLLSRQGVIASLGATIISGAATLPEAEWLMTCVTSDGAITQTPGDVYVRPYMSHYAALGLLRAYEVTQNARYLDAVYGWMAWYAARMDPATGYVNDYHGTSGSWVDSGAADSTDAYAGMYLAVMGQACYSDPAGHVSRLTPLADSMRLALAAVISTQQADGLTWALPTYQSKYLEDNVEAAIGLSYASDIASALGDTDTASTSDAAWRLMAKGLGAMWNFTTDTFDWAIDYWYNRTHNDWSNENSQRQQAWAMGWGAMVNYPTLGAALLAAYIANYPGWDTTSGQYEILPAWAMLRAGDTASAAAAVANIKANVAANNHTYPYTVASSGQLIIAEFGLPTNFASTYVNFPDQQNLMPNPSFLADSNGDGIADGVGNYGAPAMSLVPQSGVGNTQVMTSASGGEDMRWQVIPVEALRYYTFSVDRKVTAFATGGQVVLKMEMVDSGGSLVLDSGGGPVYTYTVYNVVDTETERWQITIFAPATTASIRCIIGIDGGGTVEISNPKLELAGAASPFDPAYQTLGEDTWGRADGPIGNGWTVEAGQLNVSSNTAVAAEAPAFAIRAANWADMEVYATFTLMTAGPVTTYARWVDASNHLKLEVSSTAWTLSSVVAGATTDVHTETFAATGDSVSLDLYVVGDGWSVEVDQGSFPSSTSSTANGTLPSGYATGTGAGFGINDTTGADSCSYWGAYLLTALP